MHRVLYKLFHIQESIDKNIRGIKTQNKELAGLKQKHRVHDSALEATRAEQAKSKGAMMQKEKKIKKAEKALEAKVC